jgi:hypothetical protein
MKSPRMMWLELAQWRQALLTLLDALLGLAEFVTGSVFGVFAVAGIYMSAEFWRARENLSIRLGAALFTCMLALAATVLLADAYRHLGEVLGPLL